MTGSAMNVRGPAGVESRTVTTGSSDRSSTISNAMSAAIHTGLGWANGP